MIEGQWARPIGTSESIDELSIRHEFEVRAAIERWIIGKKKNRSLHVIEARERISLQEVFYGVALEFRFIAEDDHKITPRVRAVL